MYPAELVVSLDEPTPATQSRRTLLVEPLGQPLLDLVLGNDSPCADVFTAAAGAPARAGRGEQRADRFTGVGRSTR